jgi:hypothetical protein
MSRNILGFSVAPGMHRIMEASGFFASIMRADKKKDDTSSNLPPGMPVPVLPVDYLKERPDFWIGGVGSFVCPVDSDWGLWFNWTMNNHSTAVLTSVKGMNPITGQRIDGLGLEQYQTKCPVHKSQFKHGRFCSECGFKWPLQNYIAKPNPLYWDGFRSSDGQVRQFYFTEDMAKSVPELVIGKDDTVPAFGFCFYTTKQQANHNAGGKRLTCFPKETQQCYSGLSSSGCSGVSGFSGMGGSYGSYSSSSTHIHDRKGTLIRSRLSCSAGAGDSVKSARSLTFGASAADGTFTADACSLYLASDSKVELSADNSATRFDLNSTTLTSGINVFHTHKVNAEVGIGAGAKIKQDLMGDALRLDQWNDKPAGVIRVYFVFREQFERYVAAGLNDLVGSKEGFLDGVPVGGVK